MIYLLILLLILALLLSPVAAVAVLVIGATLKNSISIVLAFLIGIMEIACTDQVILDLKRYPHQRFTHVPKSKVVQSRLKYLWPI